MHSHKYHLKADTTYSMIFGLLHLVGILVLGSNMGLYMCWSLDVSNFHLVCHLKVFILGSSFGALICEFKVPYFHFICEKWELKKQTKSGLKVVILG